MNEIYLHRNFIKRQPKLKVVPLPQPHTDSLFGQIAKRIIKKQQQSKIYPLENMRCAQCHSAVLSERNIFTGKWYYPDFNEKANLCKACEYLNAIKADLRLHQVITVDFSAWRYEKEEHLIIPFFHTLIASLDKITKESKNYNTNT